MKMIEQYGLLPQTRLLADFVQRSSLAALNANRTVSLTKAYHQEVENMVKNKTKIWSWA